MSKRAEIPATPSPTRAAAERLAEIAWQVQRQDYTTLRRLIEVQGGRWDSYDDGTQMARTIHGVTVGFPTHDPITSYVQVCFALFGQRWVYVPEATLGQKILNEQWEARTKAAKAARTAQGAA